MPAPSSISVSELELVELQRFRLLVEAISDYAIYMLGPDGTIISWNEGARRFKGYEAKEIIGKNFASFYGAEDQLAGAPAATLEIAGRTGKFEGEGWRYRKDGTRFWASVVVDAIYGPDQKLAGFAKITRDITERKIAEEALRQSKEEFRHLVQGVTDYAIYMLSPAGIVTNWNSGAERIKGYLAEEIVGQHFSRFYTENDRLQNKPDMTLETARKEGRFESEGIRVRKDGTELIAHVVVDPIYHDGVLIGYAKVTRDITEKRKAEAALRAAELALYQSQKLETIGKLTGGVAHDFNNLLQVIGGNLHLLIAEVGNNERAQSRISRALIGVGRGAKLASQLLAFGRRQPLEPKAVHLGKFLGAFQDMVVRSIGESVQTEVIASAGLWNAMVDVVQLENALLNLAINARDAMDGAGKLTIEVGNAYLDDAYARKHADVLPGQYVMLAVTDTGTGMSPEVMRQVFEPFFTTKPEGKGTGLGLSMVYGFVKQSGGHISIYSELDHGTTIKIYLPRTSEAEDIVGIQQDQVVIGGSETILVVEDDENVRIIVTDMLRELGYQVLQAPDAQSALSIVESGIRIDLLFSDVVMPGPLRSPDLARKAQERLPNIAVLFTSGYTQNAIVHGGRLDAGVDLLTKPYTREALAGKVRHAIANQQQKRQAHVKSGTGVFNAIDATSRAHPPLKILLVEDDDAIRTNTRELLMQLGCDVIEASGGQMALRILRDVPVDALVTDVNLPDMSGDDVAHEARLLYPLIGVIFASGEAVSSDLPDSFHLQKPYDSPAIAAALQRLKAVIPKKYI